MKEILIAQRADIAEGQRLAGVSLADTLRLQRATSDLFVCHALAETIDSIVDRIDACTRRLIELDEQIEACEQIDEEEVFNQLFPL